MKKPFENPEEYFYYLNKKNQLNGDAQTLKLPFAFCESCCYLMNEDSFKYHVLTVYHKQKFKDKVGHEEQVIYS